MPDNLGRIESVKKRFISLVNNAVGGNPHFAHTTSNWEDFTINIHTPHVNVRFGPQVPSDEHYGLVLSSDGSSTQVGKYEEWSVTCYLHASECRETGESQDRYVHMLTDDLKDYLEQNRFAQSAYNIDDIYDLSVREANENMPSNIKRAIMDLKLWVKRTQSMYA